MKMELRTRALDKIYKRRDRIEMPDFQRDEVWPIDKKRKLIDSILKGWHLPKLYFRKTESGTFECVDGQQRLVAIWEFYDNKFNLGSATATEFGGDTYEQLPDHVSDAFDDFEIEIDEIEDATDEELQELFSRLQLGTPLNTPEKLNAVGGEMRGFCRWIADRNFFDKKIALRDTRFAHFNIATTWAFIEARGIPAQIRFPHLEGFLKENRTFSRSSSLAKRITKALGYLDAAFPERCDNLRLKANVLSVCMLASRVIANAIPRASAAGFGCFVRSFFEELTAEVEKGAESKQEDMRKYQEAISYGSADGQSIKSRIGILARTLATKDRQFAALLEGAAASEKGASPLLGLRAEISGLLTKVNENYSARQGEDLFKFTNQAVAAIEALSESCQTPEDYGAFIDGLYKLAYEGSGSCKRLPSPPPEFAMDIKHLRTGLRHDVDHGSGTEVAKKRRMIAETLERYSGKKSLSECGPNDFAVAQLRLLDGFRSFLKGLL